MLKNTGKELLIWRWRSDKFGLDENKGKACIWGLLPWIWLFACADRSYPKKIPQNQKKPTVNTPKPPECGILSTGDMMRIGVIS